MSRYEWRSNAPVPRGRSLHDEGAEVAPKGEPLKVESVPNLDYWRKFVGRDVWIEWRGRGWDWHGQRVEGVWDEPEGCGVGLVLRAIDYRDADMGGWCCVSDANQVHEAAWADIESIRLLTDEERRPPSQDGNDRSQVRNSRIANAPRLSNAELAEAIMDARCALRQLGEKQPQFAPTLDHYKALLAEQRRRAEATP